MGTDTRSYRRRSAYAVRFMEMMPSLARRAVRKDNLQFHTVRALDTTEAFLENCLETQPIRATEHLAAWFTGPRNIFWYIHI